MAKYLWLLGGLLIAAPLRADEVTTPAVAESSTTPATPTTPAERVAASRATSTVSVSESTTTVTPPAVSTPAAAIPPPTPVTPPAATLPGMMPKPPHSFLNEMTGTVLSVDSDERVVRITVDGGFNVDFQYVHDTVLTDHGAPIEADALNYGDKIIIRYAGKDLVARQIERTTSAATVIDTH